MSNKDKESPREVRYETSDPVSKGIIAAFLLFLAGGAMIKGGFRLGEQVADEVLRRRDRDVRRQEKKEKRERKDKIREERRLEREKFWRERYGRKDD